MPSLDTTMSYHRLKKAPLDDREVFNNLRDLMDYCDNGACYNGQRVTVLSNLHDPVEYVIHRNTPIIDIRGSEPIFENLPFSGDSSYAKGMLIYERNHRDNRGWNRDDILFLTDGEFNMLDQLEIFRNKDASGNIIFKFYMIRQRRNSDEIYTATWSQNYNPYIDYDSNPINDIASGNTITAMSYYPNYDKNGHLITNNSDIALMPNSQSAINEALYITKIYVKADNYYTAARGSIWER